MHRQALIKQLLSNEGISLFWCDTILTDIINDNDDKDIRSYVHIKTVSMTVHHTPALQKSHKEVNRLYLRCPIFWGQNTECEYLKNVVAKISSYKCAQDMLLGQGITVIVNVKRSVIERIARCTQADIVSSLDAQLGTPHLGVCHRFWLRNYMMPSGRMKTLMGFDGCPKHLGCTILLRGASHAELSKVKQITQFLVYVNYNWKLECSFLMDEFALPPPLPDAMPLILYDSNQTTQRKGLFKDESMIDMHDEDLFCQKSNFSSEKIIGDELSFENEENIDKKSDEIKGFLKASKEDSTIIPKIETAKLSELHSLEEHIDPLRSECVTDTKPKSRKRSTMVVAPLPLANKFRKALNDVVLSCSPNLKYSVPYLESESGGICELRQFFGEELYWSAQFYKESVLNQNKQQMEPVKAFPHGSTTYINGKVPDNVEIQRYHPFIFTNLTNSVGNPSVSDLLANFRACGGQIKRLCPHEVANKKREKKIKMEESASLKFQSSMSMQNSSLYWERKVDALDTYKHQRLPVLFCSYSYVSNNAPNFCVSPWVVNMDFYGRNDITLGEFLERYCFRSSYECPSETCDTPMTEHIRKFVHENGSIHIVLKKLEKSFQMAESVIVMWSWCFKCKQSTPFAPMSIDTWSLSFAKYLDLRFHGISYGRRAKSCTCTHSLHHDYFQYFAYKDMVASFKYSMITLLEVCLPSIVTNIQDYIAEPAIIDEVKDLTIKGYSVYSRVLEKLCLLRERCTGSSHEVKIQQMLMTLSDERSVLRGKIGEIQVKLTSPSLEDKSMLTTYSCADSADVWCDIYDLTCYLKQMIVEAVYNWNNRIQDFINTKRKEDKAIRRQALMSLSSQGSLNSVESSTPVPSPDVLNVLVSSSHSSPLNISNETESDSVEKLSFKLKDVVPEHENTVSRHEQEYGDEQSEVLKVSQSDDDELDCSLSKSNLSNSKESVAKNSLDIEIIPEINQQSESSKIYPNINDFGGTITDENRISNSSEDNNDNLVVNPDSNKPRLQRKIGIIEDQNFFANDSPDKLYDYYVNSADKTCDTNEETVLINSDDDSEKMSQDDELFSNVRNADQPDLPKVDITMVEDNNCSDTNTELTELTETSEDLLILLFVVTSECRKAIEALDKLQEEEMRRRFPSVDATTFTSSNSSISSVTVCESAGICISNIDNEHPLNDSFTIVHRSQVRKLDDFTKEKEASKRGTRHGRSKSDGDKSVSSQLTSSSNSDVDSESLKLPQSSTSPVIKVPISQAVDKEKKVSGTMKNIFSQFLTSPLSLPVENPFPLTEHFLLKGNEENQTNKSIPIIVYDEEPSSVIAYTLSSQEYEQSLQELVFNLVLSQQKDAANSSPKSRRRNNSKDNSLNEEVPFPHSEISQSESNFSSGPKKTSVLNFVRNQSERIKVSTATNGDLSESGHHHHHMKRDSSDFDEVDNGTEINCSAEMDKNKSKIPNHHIEIQFCDSSANFYCKVYFAEQFRALRKLIFPIGEDRYIRSLARCRQWKAHGGKSGSIFCKTHDDRFILKQMSKLEVQSFAVFAAHYFKYIHQAANEQVL
ncbi:1-phosphatidylinositol 3-phosphate 5-kinase [Nymphon striatum]|nr:1-phosphatidylinositol 3-phosphate 5-kinase [Nymphon striatum]